MNRAIRNVFIVAAVLGIAAGAGWGWYSGEEIASFMDIASAQAITSTTSNFSVQQYEQADRDHARQAVMLQIALVKKLDQAMHDKTYEGQLGFAYTRLGVIEQASGQTTAARNAFNEARAWFNRTYHREGLTDEQMIKAMKGLDEADDRLY
jgi:hypothetical protein